MSQNDDRKRGEMPTTEIITTQDEAVAGSPWATAAAPVGSPAIDERWLHAGNLRGLILDRGYRSYRQIADRLPGLSRNSFYRIVNGGSVPRPETLAEILGAIGATREELERARWVPRTQRPAVTGNYGRNRGAMGRDQVVRLIGSSGDRGITVRDVARAMGTADWKAGQRKLKAALKAGLVEEYRPDEPPPPRSKVAPLRYRLTGKGRRHHDRLRAKDRGKDARPESYAPGVGTTSGPADAGRGIRVAEDGSIIIG